MGSGIEIVSLARAALLSSILMACGAPGSETADTATPETAGAEIFAERVADADFDPRWIGGWIPDDPRTQPSATVELAEDRLMLTLFGGLGDGIVCDGLLDMHASRDAAIVDCSRHLEDDSAVRVSLVGASLTLSLAGRGWSLEASLAPEVLVSTRRVDAVEFMLRSDEDPTIRNEMIHAALAAAHIDPETLTYDQALAVIVLETFIEQRQAACRQDSCRCASEPMVEGLASALRSLAGDVSWASLVGVWSPEPSRWNQPSDWGHYVVVEPGSPLRVYRFPDELLCEQGARPLPTTLRCGTESLSFEPVGGIPVMAVTIAFGDAEPATFRRGSYLELMGVQRARAVTGTDQARARLALRVANSFELRTPISAHGASVALDAAAAALDTEQVCRAGLTSACELAARHTIQRRVADDRRFRCALIE